MVEILDEGGRTAVKLRLPDDGQFAVLVAVNDGVDVGPCGIEVEADEGGGGGRRSSHGASLRNRKVAGREVIMHAPHDTSLRDVVPSLRVQHCPTAQVCGLGWDVCGKGFRHSES